MLLKWKNACAGVLLRNPSDFCPRHIDETYVNVNARWACLYSAVDSRGRTVNFYLSYCRNSKAVYRFLGKILNNESSTMRRSGRYRDLSTQTTLPPMAVRLLCSIAKVYACLTLNGFAALRRRQVIYSFS